MIKHVISGFLHWALAGSIAFAFLGILVPVASAELQPLSPAVEKVLEEIGGGTQRTMLILNKADRIEDEAVLAGLALKYPGAILTSALQASDRAELRRQIHEAVLETRTPGAGAKRPV